MSDPTPDARPQHFVIQDPQERERGWHLTVEVSEADALDLASGHVPNHVKASFRDLLEWAEQDRRRAERPYREPKTNRAPKTRKKGQAA